MAPRCVFSKFAVGSAKGPSQQRFQKLQNKLDSTGYLCGDRATTKDFLMKASLRCNDNVESTYYMPSDGVRGGRINTEDVCSLCYNNTDLMELEAIMTSGRELNGKNPLPVCKDCFDLKVKLPTSGGRSNRVQQSAQEKSTKKRRLSKAVASGVRKARKK